jgi:tRNA G10  N-methylase Trm11
MDRTGAPSSVDLPDSGTANHPVASLVMPAEASAPTTSLPVQRSLHPFPARMAPEIAFEALSSLLQGSMVLDPMCGSGTVLYQALRHGHRAIGFDVDPLAVLISRVSTQHLDPCQLVEAGETVANKAKRINREELRLPWIDSDRETQNFIEFWFGRDQRLALRSLAWLVTRRHGPIGDALRLAISKIIVTKKPCASLARDTSHSRPHRVMTTNDYDVLQGFRRAVAQIARELERDHPTGSAIARRMDARRLAPWLHGQVDMVVTSPPYGNAIDYLRGHRLSLVWLGYTIPRLRAIRSRTIGSEGAVKTATKDAATEELASRLGPISEMDWTTQHRLFHFVRDMRMMLRQVHRVLRPRGHAVLVVGNSSIRGVFLDNACMIAAVAEQTGLKEVTRYTREIPANHRYLPPPSPGSGHALGKRIREEVIMTFEKLP